MNRMLLFALAPLAACAPPPGPLPQPQQAVVAESETGPRFDPAQVQRDLETSARAKFGAEPTDQALRATTFLLAKHYVGLPPPPIIQPDGSYRYPDPPVALLTRRDGRWLAARAGGGFVPVAPAKASALDAAISDPAFWAEPAYAQPGCTDAGASLLWLKSEGKPATVRQGACGASARGERLVWLALES